MKKMKIREKLAEQYAESRSYAEVFREAHKQDFLAGYEAATKWKKVEEELPDNDRIVLVWVTDNKNPDWSTYQLGSCIYNNWYLRGGRVSHEAVKLWMEIPK